jgi:hypothetical protein
MAAVFGVAVMSTASASYNSNIGGTPTSVIPYEGGMVLFILDSQRTSNGACNAGYFEIDLANNTDAVLARMYARLLVAYTQQQPVQIGYDYSGACGSSGSFTSIAWADVFDGWDWMLNWVWLTRWYYGPNLH